MEEKNPPGRPSGSTGKQMKKFTVALPEKEYEKLAGLAERDGYKTAQLARVLIERGIS